MAGILCSGWVLGRLGWALRWALASGIVVWGSLT